MVAREWSDAEKMALDRARSRAAKRLVANERLRDEREHDTLLASMATDCRLEPWACDDGVLALSEQINARLTPCVDAIVPDASWATDEPAPDLSFLYSSTMAA